MGDGGGKVAWWGVYLVFTLELPPLYLNWSSLEKKFMTVG